jgi:hypothetical protein
MNECDLFVNSINKVSLVAGPNSYLIITTIKIVLPHLLWMRKLWNGNSMKVNLFHP